MCNTSDAVRAMEMGKKKNIEELLFVCKIDTAEETKIIY